MVTKARNDHQKTPPTPGDPWAGLRVISERVSDRRDAVIEVTPARCAKAVGKPAHVRSL